MKDQKYTLVETEILAPNESLTGDARANMAVITKLFNTLLEEGLASSELLAPAVQIGMYLEVLQKKYPEIDNFTDRILDNRQWNRRPRMIITMPVAGFGDQEREAVLTALTALSEDPLIKSQEAGVLIFANRPEGFPSDNTRSLIRDASLKLGLN